MPAPIADGVRHGWLRRLACGVIAALGAISATPQVARAQTGENVLLVVNDLSPESIEIGAYYAQKRAIPAAHVVHIVAPPADEIDRAGFSALIETPLSLSLMRSTAQDRILYIVLTSGVPLRVTGTVGLEGTTASVDSELTLLYRKMVGRPVASAGRIDNPYFAGTTPPSQFKRFTHEVADIYLVTRLDGYSVQDVKAMIDRGLTPSRTGEVVLDQAGTGAADRWLEQAAGSLRSLLYEQVLLESTSKAVTGRKGLLGYYSWGSNDPSIRARDLELTFAPGALVATFVSTDARTFRQPPEGWTIGSWNDRRTYFAGSPQSLIADLLHQGATGAAGHVAEPFLDATIRPQILFPAYVTGANLAEAFYLAMPYLSWQTVVVGDPLCAPFRPGSLTAEQIDPGIEPATELPRLFSSRRREQMLKVSNSTTVDLLLHGEQRLIKGDAAAARSAFDAALRITPTLIPAERALAALDHSEGHYAEAARRYRRVIAQLPSEVLVLNNLAYILASNLGDPAGALPFAQRAFAEAPSDPNVLDTLAWVHHLLGNNQKASALIDDAIRASDSVSDITSRTIRVVSQNAGEVRLHAAAIRLALGDVARAEIDFAEALRLGRGIANREDARQIRAALDAASPGSAK